MSFNHQRDFSIQDDDRDGQDERQESASSENHMSFDDISDNGVSEMIDYEETCAPSDLKALQTLPDKVKRL